MHVTNGREQFDAHGINRGGFQACRANSAQLPTVTHQLSVYHYMYDSHMTARENPAHKCCFVSCALNTSFLVRIKVFGTIRYMFHQKSRTCASLK
jgi:hypothetical protein